jgi:hypothetical protein
VDSRATAGRGGHQKSMLALLRRKVMRYVKSRDFMSPLPHKTVYRERTAEDLSIGCRQVRQCAKLHRHINVGPERLS